MEDQQIIALYVRRDEEAIAETERKYGAFCRRIAMNILGLREDAEECVNDTYHAAWRQIPPTLPQVLRTFLGRITRNLAISRYRSEHAQKRFDGLELLLSELEDCVPAREDVAEAVERRALSERISCWLDTLSREERELFVRRYWYGDAVAQLAKECGVSPNRTAQRLLRLRKRLRQSLE